MEDKCLGLYDELGYFFFKLHRVDYLTIRWVLMDIAPNVIPQLRNRKIEHSKDRVTIGENRPPVVFNAIQRVD
jgi:hypothetical protein